MAYSSTVLAPKPIATTMRAATITGPKKTEISEMIIPEPAAHEVRVRIEGCGVCASNMPVWEGRNWFNYPRAAGAPGHEAWGRVDAVGSEVRNFLVGDQVTMLSYHAFAEYDVARSDEVVPLPDSLIGKPFPGEALACAMNIFRRAEIEPEQNVAIIGVGFLGALLTQLASRAGARVIAVSRRPYALDVAREAGAAETVPMKNHLRIIEEVIELTSGEGCDRVIEAIGEQWPLDLATEVTRERGRLIIAGYHQDGPRQVNMQLWNWRGLDVINAHERDPRVYVAGMREAINAVAKGQLNPAPLYTHTFKLDQIDQAMEMMRDRPDGFLKAVITM
ncbi:MAG: putative zinc-type alcohol dehydrogenase-like protein YjmD [Acidobacteria bacterium]|nr:putative zinc-type alcohol dehydrogenase-like protein YjmD [Acidobacteriota bacterium]